MILLLSGLKMMSKPYRIAIDALGVNEVGGGRSVTIPLLKRVFQIKQDWQFVCYLSSYEKELDFDNVHQIILPLSKGLFSRLVFQIIVPVLTIFYKINLTHFIKSQASLVFFTKKILTIYDCTILKYPKYFNKPSRWFWRYIQPHISRMMDQIITISNDAKSEIIDWLDIDLKTVEVVYPASQFDLDDKLIQVNLIDLQNKYSFNENYLLYIGQVGLKKNLITLIKAYDLIREVRPTIPSLLLVGPRYYLSDAGEIFKEISTRGLKQNVRYLGQLQESELVTILKNAMILLFPSVHEGFGIPMVEAMQFGIPVIASNTSVMPEVIGNAGVLVDDFLSPEAWAKEIVDLLDSTETLKLLSEKGKERAKDFSWNSSALKLIEIYQRLL